jgi:precorrin-6x reductase
MTIAERLKRFRGAIQWRVHANLLVRVNMKMIGKEKSTDPGLSAAERKALRGTEAKEAMSHREEAQQLFHKNSGGSGALPCARTARQHAD